MKGLVNFPTGAIHCGECDGYVGAGYRTEHSKIHTSEFCPYCKEYVEVQDGINGSFDYHWFFVELQYEPKVRWYVDKAICPKKRMEEIMQEAGSYKVETTVDDAEEEDELEVWGDDRTPPGWEGVAV